MVEAVRGLLDSIDWATGTAGAGKAGWCSVAYSACDEGVWATAIDLLCEVTCVSSDEALVIAAGLADEPTDWLTEAPLFNVPGYVSIEDAVMWSGVGAARGGVNN